MSLIIKIPKKTFLIFALFLLALIIRFYPISKNLFFGPETGKDFLEIKNIAVNHKLTLIGAKTDIDGIFHGPFYYYLQTIPFILSNGNPVASSFFNIFLISLNAIFLFYLGKKIFSEKVALISAFLFAFSPRSVEYSRWLSAQPLSPLFSLFLFFSLYQVYRGSSKYIYFIALISGILIHLQLLHLYFTIPIIIICFVWGKIKISLKQIVLSLIIFALSLSNFLLFDLRHNFLISKNVFLVLLGKKGFIAPLGTSIRETFVNLIKETTSYLFHNLTFLTHILFFLIVIFLLKKIIRKKFGVCHLLLIFLFEPIVYLALSRHSILPHFFIFISPFIFLLTAVIIEKIFEKSKIAALIVLFLIIINNLLVVSKLEPWGITIGAQKKVLDIVYADAKGEPFRYEAFTVPYFWKDGWQYMFAWYGKKKYGYIPSEKGDNKVYFILQHEETDFYNDWYLKHVVPYGRIVFSSKIENNFVERREK